MVSRGRGILGWRATEQQVQRAVNGQNRAGGMDDRRSGRALRTLSG